MHRVAYKYDHEPTRVTNTWVNLNTVSLIKFHCTQCQGCQVEPGKNACKTGINQLKIKLSGNKIWRSGQKSGVDIPESSCMISC